jgi:hypothetical protein
MYMYTKYKATRGGAKKNTNGGDGGERKVQGAGHAMETASTRKDKHV